ncbi:MAG: ATP-binding protein [Bdellovibrionales bacterium]|nr:ATP-binding protein [Bdellovibrionales bacterium]
MVRDEAEHFRHLGKSIVVETSQPLTVAGDHLLLRRMLKNAIQNAVSFAQSEVKIKLSEQVGFAQIEVSDDGPGFKPEALRGFGEKRGTRRLDVDDHGRLSVGLGSVIMKTAAELHGGKLVATNGDRGAILTIQIPISL